MARILDSLTVPGRYLVIETRCGDQTILIHNVYAPCEASEKAAFFATLEQNQYPESAQDIILGGVNIAVELRLDSATGMTRDAESRASFLHWCAMLGVSDA